MKPKVYFLNRLEQTRKAQYKLAKERLNIRKKTQNKKKAIKQLMDISSQVIRIEKMYKELTKGKLYMFSVNLNFVFLRALI